MCVLFFMQKVEERDKRKRIIEKKKILQKEMELTDAIVVSIQWPILQHLSIIENARKSLVKVVVYNLLCM